MNTVNQIEEWDLAIVDFLDMVRKKCTKLSLKHTNTFFYYNKVSHTFDIPIIILSTLSASFAVGTGDFLEQSYISLINCGVSMIVAILSSIKLYLNIATNKTNELDISKSFYLLAFDIEKTLYLPYELRKIPQLEYLESIYDAYILLIQKSSLIKASDENEKMMKVLEKIKSSPRLAIRRQPLASLKNPLRPDEEIGFTLE
jgi:hypothetical protein